VSIYLGWIGYDDEPVSLLDRVSATIAEQLDEVPRRWRVDERPRGALDERRGQHASRAILAWLAERVPAPGARLLAVTDVDLFIPVLTFVFGEAQLNGDAAVVSTARLHPPSARLVDRLRKESVHELAHTFGLVHCTSHTCVMARSPSVAAVDVKSARLCADCQVRYREVTKEHRHATGYAANPDRR
jgi:archaemetzincin